MEAPVFVAVRPIAAPVALLECVQQAAGEESVIRTLVFRTDLIPGWVVALLGRLLAHL